MMVPVAFIPRASQHWLLCCQSVLIKSTRRRSGHLFKVRHGIISLMLKHQPSYSLISDELPAAIALLADVSSWSMPWTHLLNGATLIAAMKLARRKRLLKDRL